MLHMRSHLAPSKFSLIYCSCTASYPKLLSDFLLKYAISKHCCCFYCITNSYTSIIAASSKFSLLFPQLQMYALLLKLERINYVYAV